jgi:hypothetical protein
VARQCDVNANWDDTLDEVLHVYSSSNSDVPNKRIDHMGGKSFVGDEVKKVDLTIVNITSTPEVEGIIYGWIKYT